jgi:hypothetical protein
VAAPTPEGRGGMIWKHFFLFFFLFFVVSPFVRKARSLKGTEPLLMCECLCVTPPLGNVIGTPEGGTANGTRRWGL